MYLKKALMNLFVAAVLLACWVSLANAWQYGIGEYSYIGAPGLPGTIPGVTYYSKAGSITNDSTESETLNVDLYYHTSYTGQYQFSINQGVNWVSIPLGTTAWARTMAAGDNVWLRVILLDSNGHFFHILSPSPWGVADQAYGENYYFAFPPGSHYYDHNWNRDIAGFVAVALP